METIRKLHRRKAFTIVELVIVIAVIAILATVLVPVFGDVISNAKDSKAMQEAKNAYTNYLIENNGAASEYMVYDADGRWVALKDGAAVGVYESKEEALAAMVSNPTGALVPTNNDKFFAYGGTPVVPDQPDTPDQPSGSSFMHISFDDVERCFKNLKNNTYSSLYDEPFFGWLKGLHDTYGAKFSLYVYANSIKDVPNTYAAEFTAASDWLKIGLHADSSSNYYASSTYDQGKTAWNIFVTNIKRITGGTANIDRVPRLHMFAGTEAALKGMRDAECGALGFISADDSRVSYYFTQEIKNYLYDNDHITDRKNDLVFLSTDLRGDWFAGGNASGNPYKAPEKNTVYETLAYRYSAEEYADAMQSIIFFAHEWKVYTGSALNSYKVWFEDACKFASDQRIAFNYPQNVTLSETEYDIYPSESGDVEDEMSRTTTRDGKTVTIVNDVTEMRYENRVSISGNSPKNTWDQKGRCTAVYYVLQVKGGETVTLTQTKIGDKQLSYALLEFTDIPLTQSNINASGQVWTKWLTESTMLHTNTKYVVIGFKKGDASTDFTADELTQLPSCLELKTFETVSGWQFDPGKNNRIYTNVLLNAGDTVGFLNSAAQDSYIFAISKDNKGAQSAWIKDGDSNYQSGTYTITETGYYTIYVAKRASLTSAGTDAITIAEIEKNIGYWR